MDTIDQYIHAATRANTRKAYQSAANLKHEQSKIIKYNHLLANFAILYNVNAMTEIFNQLKQEGHDIKREHMAGFSPYRTDHYGRLGSFELNLSKKVKEMAFDLEIE